MRVLLLGGSGHVGQMTLPYLRPELDLRVFDRVRPQDAAVELVRGSVQDAAAIRRALDGTDAVVDMAVGGNRNRSYAAQAIGGDHEGKTVNCARAKAVPGWEPLERPRVAASLAG